jgi:hypothetical protein
MRRMSLIAESQRWRREGRCITEFENPDILVSRTAVILCTIYINLKEFSICVFVLKMLTIKRLYHISFLLWIDETHKNLSADLWTL